MKHMLPKPPDSVHQNDFFPRQHATPEAATQQTRQLTLQKRTFAKMATDFDYCIIGGGVAGLSIARQLSAHGQVLLIERHSGFGTETSSRNSEVIHAGLYYQAGSLKENLCLQGRQLLYAYCQQYDIPHRRIGKLIVSPTAEHPQLDRLQATARRLEIPLLPMTGRDIQQLEPSVKAETGLFSPETGIIDSHTYMARLQQQAIENGAVLVCQSEFHTARSTDREWVIQIGTTDGPVSISSHCLINSAGLGAQTVARHCGEPARQIPALYPCKGHYFSLSGRSPFRHLVYPLPEPQLAGLGVHATIDQNGQVRFGPDTCYLPSSENLNETLQSPDIYQVPETLKNSFENAIRQWYPGLESARLHPDYAGIRPKLSGPGQAATDFVIRQGCRSLAPAVHLYGIESPGLTASLAIAAEVERLLQL
jgi:L-2-hydroxyglutarate oxidase LhgO